LTVGVTLAEGGRDRYAVCGTQAALTGPPQADSLTGEPFRGRG